MGCVVNVTPRPLYPPGKTRYPLYRRLGRAQGRSGREWKISPPPGFDPRTVQPVASRYTDYVIPTYVSCYITSSFMLRASQILNLVVKSRRKSCAGHVARMGDRRGADMGGLKENRKRGRPRCRWGIILKCIFKKWDG